MASAMISVTSFAQTNKDKIESQARNPSTSENAAKADDYIINKKIIADSSQTKKVNNAAKSKSARKKKASCKTQ